MFFNKSRRIKELEEQVRTLEKENRLLNAYRTDYFKCTKKIQSYTGHVIFT